MTPRDDASDAARTQLTALTGRPWLAERWPDVREDGDEGARPAAVLILFGVLDGLPSDHEAHASETHQAGGDERRRRKPSSCCPSDS